MAEARRNWRFLLAALALGACAAAAQPGPDEARPPRAIQVSSPRTGAIAGRLTNLHSAPLGGVAVMLRNLSTGAEAQAITAKNGAFTFASLEAGTYTLEAEAGQLGRGRLEGILVTGGAEARLQFAIDLEPGARGQIEAEAPVRMPASATRMMEGSPPPQISEAAQPTAAPPASMQAVRSPRATEQSSAPTQEPPASASSAELALVIPQQSPRAGPLARVDSKAAMHAPMQPTQPATVPLLPVIEAPRLPAISPFGPREQAALETQSIPIQPALAITLPRTLPLDSRLASDLAPIASAVREPDPAAPAVANQITAEQLQALPASGRHWQDFLLDAPAASAASGSSQLSFRGTADSAQITIDGANTRLAFASGGAGSRASAQQGENAGGQNPLGQAWSARRGLGVSEAAVREVTTAAGNVEAEGMRSAGGRTSIRTESGSECASRTGISLRSPEHLGRAESIYAVGAEHGQRLRRRTFPPRHTPRPITKRRWGSAWAAASAATSSSGLPRSIVSHRNDPGLAMAKDPAEFFNLPEPTSAPVTLLSAQLGESQNQAYNDYLGVASSGYAPAGLEQLAASAWTRAAHVGAMGGICPHRLAGDRASALHARRHRRELEFAPAAGSRASLKPTATTASAPAKPARNGCLRDGKHISRRICLPSRRARRGATFDARLPTAPSSFEQSFLSGNFWGQLPQIVVDSRYGFTIGNPSRFGQGSYPDERLYHGQQMLDWVHNHLLVKAGFELDHNADATSLLRNQTGTYHYSNVASFISDALAFQKFGFADALDPRNPHNCGTTDTKFGSQPCYSYFSQTMGPTNWHLSTNDWAGYVTAQWQPAKLAVFSAGLRWEREQMPPPIAALANPELPAHADAAVSRQQLGSARRASPSAHAKSRWPVLRLGYGMYYGRTENATIETALTQTGSLSGDLSFFMRPSDDCQFCSGGAPPFPYVFAGQPSSVVKPGAVEFAPNFRNPEIHQAVAAVEKPLPGRMRAHGQRDAQPRPSSASLR